MSSEILQCPDCGDRRFSWAVKQVQFGNVHRFEDGTVDVESMDQGHIVDDDTHRGVYCTGCDQLKDLDKLVEVDENE